MADEKRGETFVMRGGEPSPEGPISFSTFILGLASTTLIHLGVAPHPETARVERNLTLARETLDLLSMLNEKTRGNLSEEEARLFHNILTDLRLRYVEANKR